MANTIREAMTSNPSTVQPGTPIAEAAQVLKNEDAGVVPVVQGDQLVGMLTDRDIVIRVIAEGKDPQSTTVEQIATKQLVTIDPQQNLDEALRLMAQHQVRRLPVVEEDGRLVGVIAQADVAKHADPAKAGQMVEEISQ